MIHLISTLLVVIVFRRSSELPVRGALEVPVHLGRTVELQCGSNDENHSFLFWQINNAAHTIIGPGNDYDRAKYEYEVLSGKLFVRGVTEEEEGVYNCVSRGVRNDNINVRTVTLVVRKDWQIIYEEDPTVNFFRAVVVVGVVAILMGGSYLIYVYCSPHGQTLYLDPSDEDESVEELFESQPSTSRRIVFEDKHRQDGGYENTALSTDFNSILDNSAK